MTPFESAVRLVLDIETDRVTNDPNDPGGLTKYGISKRAYPDLDIANLTEAQAVEIYRRDYWNKCRGDELPPAVACVVFDCAVNQGLREAGLILQRSLRITADGVIGSQTALAAGLATSVQGLVRTIVTNRGYVYGTSRGFPAYGRGWLDRLLRVYDLAVSLRVDPRG